MEYKRWPVKPVWFLTLHRYLIFQAIILIQLQLWLRIGLCCHLLIQDNQPLIIPFVTQSCNMNLGIIRQQVFVHCLYLYYTKIMWNCAFAMLNRLWDVPCLNEHIFKRVYLNHFIVVTCSQAVYPYIMEWEVEKILQLLSQDCRCKWQTNKQWVCHDAAGAGGSGGSFGPGQAARAHPAAQPGAGLQGAPGQPQPRASGTSLGTDQEI